VTPWPGASRFPAAVGALCATVLLAGCATTALKQGEAAEGARDFDLAVAQYTKAVREHPSDADIQKNLDRAKLRASDTHLLNGRRLFSVGKFDEALLELQLASELNPANGDADRDLQAVRAALRAKLAAPENGKTQLESLLAKTRDAMPAGNELPDVKIGQITTGRQMTSRELYMTLAKLGNLSVTFDQTFREAPVQASLLNNMTLKQALDTVARSTNTFYQVQSPTSIIVIPDTPAKRREYTEEVFKTFYVQNADLKQTMDALRVVGDLRSISPLEGTNAIMVRDTPERVQAVGRFLASFDKARPEVVVDVEVLEVDRDKLMEYGAQIASAGSPGLDGAAAINPEGLTLDSLRKLSASDVLVSGIPALYYKLLKTDSHTRTLANPHLRMSDGIAGSANFGEDVPVPQTTLTPIIQQGANIQPQTTFQYRTIGVNIKITPRTHPNDDVTLALSIELSSEGGTGFDGLPTFGNRKVDTTLRLRDGETNILAGLIRNDERYLREGIPPLTDIPGLSHLFTHNRKEIQTTDVVVMLTPHIVRVLDLTEDDLRPLRVPREGNGAALIEGAPIVPPPPIRSGGGGGGK
jgi:general secretion pathway protein D